MIASRYRGVWRQVAGLVTILVAVANASSLHAQEDLANGADFNALLRAQTRIAPLYEGTPPRIRNHVENFRTQIGIAIFLDRRVDPDAPLALDIPEMRVEFAMREFALRQKMGLVVRENYLYLGPLAFCRWWPGELDLLAKQIGKLPTAEKQFWQAKSIARWEEGATPRELAEGLAGARLSNAESARIPHDVWAAFESPELPRFEQLALICGGFDLVPELSNKGEVTLRRLLEGRVQTASVSVPPAAISEAIESIQRYFPDVKAVPKASKLEIEGSFGELKTIRSWFQAPPASRKAAAPKSTGPVILLTTPVPVPARELLLKLAQAAKCELVIAPDVAPAAISKKIQPAWKGTGDELLRKISAEIGLNCQYQEGKLVVQNP